MNKKLLVNSFIFSFFILLTTGILTSCNSTKQADLIVHNGKIYTVDSAFTIVEAMVVKDKKIIATGSNKNILEQYNSSKVVDLGGKAVFPGFIDAHCHFTGFATDMWKCELVGTTSFEDIIHRLKDYSQSAPMEWIYGRGWDQNDWAVKEFPSKEMLDSLFPNRPVFLKRIDGHAALVNQVALNRAGITASTKVEGGSVELKNGMPTGLLIDNAMDIVDRIIPQITDSLAKKYYVEAQRLCFAVGLTGVHDCGVSEHTVQLVDEEQKAGRLKMKIFALLSDSAHYYESWLKKGPYITPALHVGGFKIYSDGALGSRGACLLKEYSDKPGWKGFLLSNKSYFDSIANLMAASELQMCTHAIGDSANRQILKSYANVLKGKNDRRWRIEHAQVVDAADFHFFKDYTIIPSVQPTHATSDMYWAETRLGSDRIKTAYAYKQLLNENGWMPLGTDFPVEDISPFKTFYAAVARKDAKEFPPSGFQKENALTREQALRGMTIWAAKAAFEEKEKGSLEAGKAADFIILDTDIMNCPENQILNSKPVSVYLNGTSVLQL